MAFYERKENHKKKNANQKIKIIKQSNLESLESLGLNCGFIIFFGSGHLSLDRQL